MKGRWWPTFGRIAVLFFIAGLASSVSGAVGLTTGVMGGFGGTGSGRAVSIAAVLFSQLVSAVVAVPVGMLQSAGSVVTYAELRSKQQYLNSTILATEAS